MHLYEPMHMTDGSFDCHIHLEGMACARIPELFYESLAIADQNNLISTELTRIIRRPLRILEKDFQAISSNSEKRKVWSFEQFLTKLYITKLILSTDYDLAQQFITEVLREYYLKHDHIRFSMTPSLPYDFPHLDAQRWYQAVFEGMQQALSKGKTLHLILETKRQHLTTHSGKNSWVYQANLDFLAYLLDMNDQRITYSLGICDNEEAYPLHDPERHAHLIDYLRANKLNKKIGVSVHTLENGKSASISAFEQTRELRVLLSLMKEMRIDKATFIHLGNVFSGVNPSQELRTKRDQHAITLGLTLLRKIAQRGDTIVTCLTSNRRLGNPNLLSYPEVLKLILEEGLKVTLGSDDPWVFGLTDIDDETEQVSTFLEKQKTYPAESLMNQLLANRIF